MPAGRDAVSWSSAARRPGIGASAGGFLHEAGREGLLEETSSHTPQAHALLCGGSRNGVVAGCVRRWLGMMRGQLVARRRPSLRAAAAAYDFIGCRRLTLPGCTHAVLEEPH